MSEVVLLMRGQLSRGISNNLTLLHQHKTTANPRSIIVNSKSFTLHVGDSVVVDQVCKSYIITIQRPNTWVDLLLLDILDGDIIIGMD